MMFHIHHLNVGVELKVAGPIASNVEGGTFHLEAIENIRNRCLIIFLFELSKTEV